MGRLSRQENCQLGSLKLCTVSTHRPKRFLTVTRCLENLYRCFVSFSASKASRHQTHLSSGEKRAGCADFVISPVGVFFCSVACVRIPDVPLELLMLTLSVYTRVPFSSWYIKCMVGSREVGNSVACVSAHGSCQCLSICYSDLVELVSEAIPQTQSFALADG